MQASFVGPPRPSRSRPVTGLAADVLRRRGGQRALTLGTAVLFLAGVALFAYPVGTDVYGHFRQGQLQETFTDPGVRQAYRRHQVRLGSGLTLLRIPRIGLKVLVVEGTTADALRAGAGHYVETPLPGETGNVAIAGHRTTFGRPFNRLDELRPGDLATLQTPVTTYTYRAVPAFGGHANPWVVAPDDFSVLAAAPTPELTLTTCTPKGSASHRLILRLALVGSAPRPAGG